VITRDLSTMIAVASGNKAQVTRWEDCLERARIEFVVAEPLDPPTDAGFRAEIWVAREDAEEARAVLRHSCVRGARFCGEWCRLPRLVFQPTGPSNSLSIWTNY
jgi:hypothetical protein